MATATEKSTAQERAEERESGPADKTHDDLRRPDVLGSQVTQIPNNLLDLVRENEDLQALVVALRRCDVGSFQFMGDTRTPEAALRAALNLRRVLNENGVDVRKMSDKERKAFVEAQPGPDVATNENA